jgi:hypothetical protein
MAAAQETKIRDYIKAGKQAGKQPRLAQAAAGLRPGLAGGAAQRAAGGLVSGDAIPDESHKLLAMVHYESELMSIRSPGRVRGGEDRKAAAGDRHPGDDRLQRALLLGFFLGGFRALYRMARGKPVSSVYDVEFIRLNLRD